MTQEPEIIVCTDCGSWKYRSKTNVGSKCFHGGKNHISEELKKQGFRPFHPTWGCQGTFEVPHEASA